MQSNPFSYTSRDYNTLLGELNTLFPNKPDWFKTAVAGMFSIAHWYLDARAQNLLLNSAFTPEAVLNLCAFLDYYPKNISPATGQVVVKLKAGTTLPHTMSAASQIFAVRATRSSTPLPFEGAGDVTFTGLYAKVPLIQGSSTSVETIGTSNGSQWQEFPIFSENVQMDSIRIAIVLTESPVTIENWTVVDTLINSTSLDKHVRIIKKPEGIIVAQFGDGEYGSIPTNGLRIVASYREGGGTIGNIKAGNTQITDSNIGVSNGTGSQIFIVSAKMVIATLTIKINGVPWAKVSDVTLSPSNAKHYEVDLLTDGTYRIKFGNGTNGEIPANTQIIYATYQVSDNVIVDYSGSDADYESAYLYEDFNGGAAAETEARSKVLAPMSLKSVEKAVLEEDFEYLSKRYSTSIVSAKCLPFYYGSTTIGIHIIPSGGGNPATPIKTGLQDFIKARTTLRVLDVRVRNPLYVPNPADFNPAYQALTITTTLFLRSGYNSNQFYAYGLLVLRLLVSEVTTEIFDIYDSTGIDAAVEFINNKWVFGTYVFGVDDYTEIINILERRRRDGVLLWGGRLRPNDIVSALSDLSGADYAEVAAPSSIVVLPFDRVFTDSGTVFNLTVS